MASHSNINIVQGDLFMFENDKQNISQKTKMEIGGITYIVNTHFKENGRETAEQKLLRYVTNRISAEMKSDKNPENKGENPFIVTC